MDPNSQDWVHSVDDMVGQPYAVLESDPAVFTSMMQKLGVFGVQAQEIMTLDALDARFRTFGFVFCFKWSEDSYHPEDYYNDGPEAEIPWFASQLSDDSCATLALLNILLNCEDVDIGPTLTSFKEYTSQMDPKMRGLCLASSSKFRHVHNSFARPIDIRASISKVAHTTLHPPKSATKGKKVVSKKKTTDATLDAYHFLSYVSYRGKVWEMDGLKKAPLECAEIEGSWVTAVLPALRSRMDSFSKSGDIRFSLIALTPSVYQSKVDELELAKREVTFLERRLEQEFPGVWRELVPNDLIQAKEETWSKISQPRLGIGFGARSNEVGMRILRADSQVLVDMWQNAVRRLRPLQLAVDEETRGFIQNEIEHIKRTHDYDPFIREYMAKLYNAGFLHDLLDVDALGRPRQAGKGNKR